jgi:hypothetical protein
MSFSMPEDKIYVCRTDDGQYYRFGGEDLEYVKHSFALHFPNKKLVSVSLVVWEDFGDEE